MRKFTYNEIAVLNKYTLIFVKVGVKFDSTTINDRRNRSGISYYIEGYSLRDWCYEEELKKMNFIHKILFFFLFKKF